MALAEVTIRAHYGPSSAALRDFRLAAQMLVVQRLFVAGRLTLKKRGLFADVLSPGSTFGPDEFDELRSRSTQIQADLVEHLLTEPIKLA